MSAQPRGMPPLLWIAITPETYRCAAAALLVTIEALPVASNELPKYLHAYRLLGDAFEESVREAAAVERGLGT